MGHVPTAPVWRTVFRASLEIPGNTTEREGAGRARENVTPLTGQGVAGRHRARAGNGEPEAFPTSKGLSLWASSSLNHTTDSCSAAGRRHRPSRLQKLARYTPPA